MQKYSIIASIVILTGFLLYALQIVSSVNTCTGVRSFLCQKQSQKGQSEVQSGSLQNQTSTIVSETPKAIVDATSSAYASLQNTGKAFVHLCNPEISVATGSYVLDYSKCNLSVVIWDDQKTVREVRVNNEILTQDQIDENLAKLWFTF